MFDWLRKLTRKPALSTYTPPPAPKGRSAARPAVTVTRAAGPSLQVNLFGGWFARTSHQHAAPAARVAQARARTAARRVTPGASRPATAAEVRQVEQRKQERAKREAEQREQAVQEREQTRTPPGKGQPTVIEGEVVKVHAYKRDGQRVAAHTRSKPESEG